MFFSADPPRPALRCRMLPPSAHRSHRPSHPQPHPPPPEAVGREEAAALADRGAREEAVVREEAEVPVVREAVAALADREVRVAVAAPAGAVDRAVVAAQEEAEGPVDREAAAGPVR